MDAPLQFLTREFTVYGIMLQYWMPFVAIVFLIWIALALKMYRL